MNLFDRMKLPFRKNKEFLSVLYDILGFYPHDIEIYRIAFAHKSLAYRREERPAGRERKGTGRPARNERPSKPLNNERLEFLGDAVLESVVSDILFRHFPQKREGFLTSTRSKIVQRETLNRLAADLGLEKLIQAAQGTDMSRTNIGGNAFEALMGAIYLDRGYKLCHWFIAHRVIGHFIDVEAMAHKEVNFKSKLIEWSQKNRINIDFKDSSNEQKGKGFHTAITLEGIVIGRGNGRSKKESQQEAAKDALTLMRRDVKTYDSIFRAKEKRTAMEAEESFALPKIDEIEEALARGEKKAQRGTPVYEEKKSRRPQSDSDAAYDTAYDAEAEYEVIDTPPAQPRPTAADYAAKGLPLPPSEDDAQESEPAERPRRKQSRGGKTVEEALAEKAQRERAAKEKTAKEAEKKEKAPKAEAAPDKAPKEKPQRERDRREKPAQPKTAPAAGMPQTNEPAEADQKPAQQPRKRRPESRQPATNPAAEPEVVVVKDLATVGEPRPEADENARPTAGRAEQPSRPAAAAAETHSPAVTAAPLDEKPATDLPAEAAAEAQTVASLEAEAQVLIDAYEAAGLSVTPSRPAAVPAAEPEEAAPAAAAADSLPPAADKAEAGLEDLSEALGSLGAIPEEVEAEIAAFAAGSGNGEGEPELSEKDLENIGQNELSEEAMMPSPTADLAFESSEKDSETTGKNESGEEAGTGNPPTEPAADDLETDRAALAAEAFGDEEAEAPLPEDEDDETETDEDGNAEEYEAGNAPQPKPASLSDATPKPILRHLSIDDFVFGTDPTEDQPWPADSEDEADDEPARKPNRRRRRPARRRGGERPEAAEASPREASADDVPQGKSGSSKPRRHRRRRPSGPSEA